MSARKTKSEAKSKTRKKVTVFDLQKKKQQSRPITMITAYDYSSALLSDQAEIDVILVGDSLAMVMLGLDNTLPVTMDQMVYHCSAVARGARNAFLVGDMPFMSYQADTAEAVRNAGRFLKEGAMDGVKLEGGSEVSATTKAIVGAGIPVMGHIGLTPQSASKLGGFRVQGKSVGDAMRLLDDAMALEKAGCFSLVLEAVPAGVAEVISEKLKIPTIGIGAGPGCDGQVLVYHDVLGLFDRFTPKFVKQYANVGQSILQALQLYAEDVENGRFPAEEHTYPIAEDELSAFLERAGDR
jgi:3-methyl-2-oxobutanoate hydroxymethyltransferase